MKLYVGMDLHSKNTYIVVIDEDDRKVLSGRYPNNIELILQALQPHKESIVGVAIESTYNWYWLADGLMDNDYKVHLAHPAAMKQYNGLKNTNDRHDAFWLARLLKLAILPEGYIYPKGDRPLRDLGRKRMMFVDNRARHILSFESMVERNLGKSIDCNTVKKMKEVHVESLFKNDYLVLAGKAHIGMIKELDSWIKQFEKELVKAVKHREEFVYLKTVPGIGQVLAIVILLETGDIRRFEDVGDYVSYCRGAGSDRLSNGKVKGHNNRKNGNKYLAWAFLEAANKMVQFCAEAKRYHSKKLRKTKINPIASKSLASKIARACYYILKDGVAFDVKKMFG